MSIRYSILFWRIFSDFQVQNVQFLLIGGFLTRRFHFFRFWVQKIFVQSPKQTLEPKNFGYFIKILIFLLRIAFNFQVFWNIYRQRMCKNIKFFYRVIFGQKKWSFRWKWRFWQLKWPFAVETKNFFVSKMKKLKSTGQKTPNLFKIFDLFTESFSVKKVKFSMKMTILPAKVAIWCGNEKFFRLKNEKFEIYGSKNPL